jgi:hypothetical protein
MTRMLARLATLSLAVLAFLAEVPAGAEQERVDGMGRTQGWVVATEAGDLGFVDCRGQRSGLGGARVEPAAGRCPSTPPPFEMTGVVRTVDPVRRVVHAEDEAGHPRAFHVTHEVSSLEALQPGERIRATGPIDGQATRITRP